MPADNRTTAQDIQSTIDNISESDNLAANIELGRFERLMVKGNPAVLKTEGPKIVVNSPTAATTQAVTPRVIVPPNDHDHWKEGALSEKSMF